MRHDKTNEKVTDTEPSSNLRRTIRRAVIRPVSQVVLNFKRANHTDEFANIRTAALNWLSERAGKAIPTSAWSGDPFELEEIGAQRVAAVGIKKPRFWAARLDDADKAVPQRTWVTEIGIGQAQDDLVLFGVRLTSVSMGDAPEYERTIPGFVRGIIAHGLATLDGRVLVDAPWIVDSDGEVQEFVDFLCNKNRRSDVIVFTLPEGSSNPSETIISALDIHRRTLGAAHVAVLTSDASFALSSIVGKEFSVFRQAARTYLSGFDPHLDEPSRHPLSLPKRIQEWPDGGLVKFADFLVSRSLARSVAKVDREYRLPSFETARRIAAREHIDLAREKGSSDSDLLAIAEDEIRRLNKSIESERDEFNDLLETAENEREEARQDALQARGRADSLSHRLNSLDARLKTLEQTTAQIEIPDDLEEFESWTKRNMAGDVEIHNRAFQGIKKSIYSDPPFIYQVLLLLRDCYVPMRRNGDPTLKDLYYAECARLGLEDSQTFSGQRWGEEGDTYIVNYGGKKRLLDRHLKKGTSKDERYCFRLYYFWDEDNEQVVVGWLPSHLGTRQT